jgi:aminopeptidase
VDVEAFWADRSAELEQYARLAARVGINVRQGQDVTIIGEVEHAPLVRAIARVAYQEGARLVQVEYLDEYVRRERAELAADEAVGWAPPWMLQRVDEEAARETALVSIVGVSDPDLFDGLDPKRVTESSVPQRRRAIWTAIDRGAIPWTIIGFPTPAWAKQVFGEPDVGRLWDAIRATVRLDEADPVAAWTEHVSTLAGRAAQLNERGLDALRFRGPGTDLTVGLMPQSRWVAGGAETASGQYYVPNLPTEEVFTTPDRRRTEGRVRSTQPLVLLSGKVVQDLEISFSGGRIVEVSATSGADDVRAEVALDEGASYLGEVALVDERSRVGQAGMTFWSTLYDENAASHIAYGTAVVQAVELDGADPEQVDLETMGVNQSGAHTDFMIGGPEVEVDGLEPGGGVVPLVRDNAWQLT